MSELYLGQRQRRGNLLLWVLVLLALLLCSRYIAGTFIAYAWWSELHQVDTWINQLIYGTGPFVVAALLLFAAFFWALSILSGISSQVKVEIG